MEARSGLAQRRADPTTATGAEPHRTTAPDEQDRGDNRDVMEERACFDVRQVHAVFERWRGDRAIHSASAAVEALVAFWTEHKARGLAAWAGEEDMLMAEWGASFENPSTEIQMHLVRQIATESGECWQLAIDLTFPRSVDPHMQLRGTDWVVGLQLVEKSRDLVGALGHADAIGVRSAQTLQ